MRTKQGSGAGIAAGKEQEGIPLFRCHLIGMLFPLDDRDGLTGDVCNGSLY